MPSDDLTSNVLAESEEQEDQDEAAIAGEEDLAATTVLAYHMYFSTESGSGIERGGLTRTRRRARGRAVRRRRPH